MENKIIFREMLSEIKTAADVYDGRISKSEIREILSGMPLTEEHFGLIYEYLEGQNIRVTEDRESGGESGVPGQIRSGGARTTQRSDKAGSDGAQEKQSADKIRSGDAQTTQRSDKAGSGGVQEKQSADKIGSDGAQEKQSADKTGTDSAAEEETAEGGSGGLEGYLQRLLELAEESFEDEHALLGRVMNGDEAAKARLIESYLPLICEAAGNFKSEEVLLEDLIQEGNLGLLEALGSLEQFDSPAACSAHILNTINEAMAWMITSSREKREADGHIVSRVNHLNEAVKNLERDLEHKVSAEELSAYLEMPLQEIRDILRMSGDQIELEGENK